MNRRNFLKTAVSCTAATALWPKMLRADYQPHGKNIVLILADDVGAPDISVYGNNKFKTPHLAAMAKQGTTFKTCWATPICSPSRAEIMTGKYATRTEWWHNSMRPYSWKNEPGGNLAQTHVLFSEALKRYGYATAFSGKWQLQGSPYPTRVFDFGFDEYCIHHEWTSHLPEDVTFDGPVSGPEHLWPGRTSGYWHPCIFQNGTLRNTKPQDYGPDIYCDFLIDFIHRHKDRPFLAYYSMMLAHTATDVDGSGRECFIPTPELDENGQPTGKRTPEGFQYSVEYMDHIVGRIVKALDQAGLREDTVILFAGDNGSLGNGKAQPTEAGVRVPLICSCPGTIRADVLSDELVDFSDVLPTILDFAEARLPAGEQIDGQSFAPILRGEANAPTRDYIFSYYAYHRLLRDKRWCLDGHGRFYDCGNDRTGKYYKDVTDSLDPEVLMARERFNAVLQKFPTLPPEHPYRKRYEKEFVEGFSKQWKDYEKKWEKKEK